MFYHVWLFLSGEREREKEKGRERERESARALERQNASKHSCNPSPGFDRDVDERLRQIASFAGRIVTVLAACRIIDLCVCARVRVCVCAYGRFGVSVGKSVSSCEHGCGLVGGRWCNWEG